MKLKLSDTTNNSESAEGCSGQIKLLFNNGSTKTLTIPSYIIPNRSETSSSNYKNKYDCAIKCYDG
jgi:hypothetical protein